MEITRLCRRFPSPALILSCLALFAALGGSTYAATHASAGTTLHFTNAMLENGWHRPNPIYARAGYAKDPSGVVHLRGALSGGGPNTAGFVLPSGLRPSHRLYIPAVTTGGSSEIVVYATGKVLLVGTAFTSLDGISFAAGE
jgi:hypothetical protein